MAYENKAGLGVNNQYGPRDTGGTVGVINDFNAVQEIQVDLTPEFLNGTFVPPVVLPKGALFRRATLRVDEAFTMTGTTPGIVIGAATLETTNGIAITAAELAAVGTKVPASTGTGTWAVASATGTTVAAKIGKALTGAGAAVTVGAGKGRISIEFYCAAKL